MFGEPEKQRIYVGSDHAGFQAKEAVKAYLEEKDEYEVTDLGCFSEDSCDYPDTAREVGEKIAENNGALGVLICGSGIGVAMAANKIRGVRAAMINNENLAEMARKHNDANVITMGARHTEVEDMKKYLDVFLKTDFESGEERHVRRVQKIDGQWNGSNTPGTGHND